MEDKILVPDDGIEITIPEKQTLSKITMEPSKGGLTLAVVGSASATAPRQTISLSPSKGGITLALVGSASGTK